MRPFGHFPPNSVWPVCHELARPGSGPRAAAVAHGAGWRLMARAEPPDSTAPWQLQPATVASGELGKKKQWIVLNTWPGLLCVTGKDFFLNITFFVG